MVTRFIIRHLCDLSPEIRRIWAARILLFSIAGWLTSHVLLVAFDQSDFFTHTLMFISWWAIIVTCIDVIATSDVRAEQQDNQA
jgi:hypothetical protein